MPMMTETRVQTYSIVTKIWAQLIFCRLTFVGSKVN